MGGLELLGGRGGGGRLCGDGGNRLSLRVRQEVLWLRGQSQPDLLAAEKLPNFSLRANPS